MSTSTLATRLLGTAALATTATAVYLGLVWAPTAVEQGDVYRLLYVHVPSAWLAYLAFAGCTLASALYLWRRTRSRVWDLLAGAAAEVGVVFTGLTLLTGMLWGKPTWGTWWTWDARLTTTALLFVLYLGYLALRRLPADVEVRSRRAAIAALVAFVDVPIVHYSVTWWRTLHQGSSFQDGVAVDIQLEPEMTTALLAALVAFTLLFAWLVTHRFRLGWLEEREEELGLTAALHERRAEAEPAAPAPSLAAGAGEQV